MRCIPISTRLFTVQNQPLLAADNVPCIVVSSPGIQTGGRVKTGTQ
jgi:hypothetical protein